MINQQQQRIILDHVKVLHPLKVGIFGSYARGEYSKNSDLDILVTLDYDHHRVSLFDLIGVEQELSQELGIKVDLVTEKSLHPEIRPYVERDLKIIFDEKPGDID